jgi:adenylate kinase family enzyme
MTAILVTGMSGTGKSTALAELARRGYRVVDTDEGDWSIEVPAADGSGVEQLWREERIRALLSEPPAGPLFVSGCVANQGTFSAQFAATVLLTVPEDVLVGRLASRETNDFGKTEAERARILNDLRTVEPLLRAAATDEIDTRLPVSEVADRLESIASRSPDG